MFVLVHESSRFTEERLDALYVAEGFGGDTTMRAKVIRELIDEVRSLRSELRSTGSNRSHRAPAAEDPSP
jgi:hypothetical protein